MNEQKVKCPQCKEEEDLTQFEINDSSVIADTGCEYACPNCGRLCDYDFRKGVLL